MKYTFFSIIINTLVQSIPFYYTFFVPTQQNMYTAGTVQKICAIDEHWKNTIEDNRIVAFTNLLLNSVLYEVFPPKMLLLICLYTRVYRYAGGFSSSVCTSGRLGNNLLSISRRNFAVLSWSSQSFFSKSIIAQTNILFII